LLLQNDRFIGAINVLERKGRLSSRFKKDVGSN